MSKKCSKCKQIKELIYFHKNKSVKSDGHENRCKACALIAQAKYRASDNGKIKYREHARNGYHRTKITNPKQHKKRQQANNNRQKLHRKEKSEYDRLYRQRRKKEDIQYMLADLLRKRLWAAFKGKFKAGSGVADLGCSIEKLEAHLESMFYPNTITGEIMSWNNRGKKGWQIDHIRPLFSFNLEDPEQVKIACSYKNLQPLWNHDHIEKSKQERLLFLIV